MQLSQPEILFSKQKVVRTSTNNPSFLVIDDTPRKVLVIYDNAAQELPTQLKEMLDKLIHACKFSPSDTLYVNHRFNPVSLGEIQNKFQPENVLLFGNLTISRNMTQLKKNHPYEINGIKILHTESLEKLEQVKSEKTVLWNSLKQMLNM